MYMILYFCQQILLNMTQCTFKYEMCVFQGQQARLATLYLPLFSLMLENVHRLNIRDAAPLTSQTNMVRLTPSVALIQFDLILCV